MASTIKIEVNLNNTTNTFCCHGCLSQNRKLTPLSEEISKLYYSLLGSGTLYSSEERMICWECEAMLRRVKKFQNHILQAQTKLLELFYNMSPNLETLSNLSITTKDYYDLHYEFIEQTYTETEYILEPNEYRPETTPDSKLTSELLIENSPVKIENLKQEAESSQHSDYEDNFNDETKDLEISNESNINNRIDEYKEEKKEFKTEANKDTKPKKKRNINNSQLSRHRSAKYLKYATVRVINCKFEQNGKTDTSYGSYFIKEFFDLEKIEEYNAKLAENSCGDRCMECRLYARSDFLSIMRQNLRDIEPDSTTNCLLCKKTLSNFDELHSHWKNSHCEFYKCTLCNYYCKRSGRLNHLNDQHTKVYSCKKCSKEFTSEYHFKLHFKRLHDTFVCHHCNKVSTNRSMMIKHLVKCHADRPTKGRLKFDRNSTEQRLCTICNKVYASRRCLLMHISAHHPETKKKKVDKEAAYCVECDKQFKSVKLFKWHLAGTRIHNPKLRQSYPCPECDKIFTNKYSVEYHVHQVHRQEKARFKCTICNKIYNCKTSLQAHNDAVHLKLPKKKDKLCDICGRGFQNMRMVKNHRRTHTGEQPYKCLHCPSAFAQKVACIGHMRKQHNDTNKYAEDFFLTKK